MGELRNGLIEKTRHGKPEGYRIGLAAVAVLP